MKKEERGKRENRGEGNISKWLRGVEASAFLPFTNVVNHCRRANDDPRAQRLKLGSNGEQ